MDRIYGRDLQCYVCGREPSIGFLYECRQDYSSPSLHNLLEDQQEIARPKSPLRSELEEIGLSESVIRTAEHGHYSPMHLETLKAQKQDLKQIIEDTVQGSQINDMVARLAALSAPSNNDGTMNSKAKTAVSTSSLWDLMEDTDETHKESPFPTQTTITFADSTNAPHTASTTASDSSELTFKTTQTDVDELRALRRPRRRFYNIGHRSSGEIARDLSRIPPLLSRQGLKTAMQAIFHPGRDSSSSGSMITLPVPRTGTVRDSSATRPVGDFDIGALRRVRRQKERNEIRNGTYTGGYEDVGSAAATIKSNTAHSPHSSDGEGSYSSDSDFSVYSCISEGSDDEVEGGVAFTEEAIDSRTPDILAVDVRDGPPSKSAICIRTKPVSWTEEGSEDIGVQSIMAQV
ncbi:hypothetical protein SLS61_003244 [Didymella pomorum]